MQADSSTVFMLWLSIMRTRVRVATDTLTLGAMQCGIEPEPGALEAKASEMVEDRLPMRDLNVPQCAA